jgi:hypothetical protein
LWLFHQRTNHAQTVGVAPRFGDLVGVPFGGAPVEGFSGIDDVVEGADGLFNGRVPVRAVRKDEVDVVKAEALEGEIEAFDYVLAGEADVVDAVLAVGAAPVDLSNGVRWRDSTREKRFGNLTCLGGYNKVVALPAEFFNGSAHCFLTLSTRIAFGAVEKVDTDVIGSLHACEGVFWP